MARPEDLFDVSTLPAGDEGMTEMVVFLNPRTGKVIQRFARPMLFVAYDPVNCANVGKQMIDVAVEGGAQVTIEVKKRQITDRQRAVLITRVDHILKNLLERGRPRHHIAQQVVDTILTSEELS